MSYHGLLVPNHKSEERNEREIMGDQYDFLVEHYDKCERKDSPACHECQRYLALKDLLTKPFSKSASAKA